MDMTLAGFVALGALIIGLFAWLRQDIRELRMEMIDRTTSVHQGMADGTTSLRQEMIDRTTSLHQGMADGITSLRQEMIDGFASLRGELIELRERVARTEGLLEAVFMRRDPTPLPEPPPPGDRPDKSKAA